MIEKYDKKTTFKSSLKFVICNARKHENNGSSSEITYTTLFIHFILNVHIKYTGSETDL